MATQAQIGIGTSVYVTKAGVGATRTKLAELKDITWPESQADEIDVTNMDSGNTKEYIGGLIDNGEVKIPMNWIPGSGTDTLLTEIFATREIVTIEFVLPGESTGDAYFGFCKGYTRNAPVNEALTAEATFRISGPATP
ncbi:phage tail tube protein [Paracoccus sulfuroxidans]|uniref:Lambda phage tail tube protein N-terminal domain-containing protein n=1 Tax=Paracoccus sulfuroxidans TaxID=384678 RepID=A0A562P164_9RHOB|nr:phage tail tube protein [Paracoccus sulfuroxidans]TWI38228.1 hypothetical protein IQ24_00366 [Paracoccus sulfuroxidans]